MEMVIYSVSISLASLLIISSGLSLILIASEALAVKGLLAEW